MFECLILLHLPLTEMPDVQIAKYNFDPGLQVGEPVDVIELKWGSELFSFEAVVKVRKYQIKPQNDSFRLLIGLEMADKEQLLQLVKILKELNLGEIR
jgi:hypothetical protein